jgi:hypothetical protein
MYFSVYDKVLGFMKKMALWKVLCESESIGEHEYH